jgi:hypothetical protein
MASGEKVMTETARTGGCQCGAVRFRIHGALGRSSICHCRMCQKQFGSFLRRLRRGAGDGVEWIREEPSYFQSSINISRGFCQRCGTPMAYRHAEGLELSIGSFDDRSDLAPTIQINHGFRLPWVETIFDQPVLDNPRLLPAAGADHLLPASR